MKSLLICFLVGFLTSFPGCRSQTTTQKSPEFFFDSFIMGWGGGFTGHYDEFRISVEGSISKRNFENEVFEEYGLFPAKEAQLIFKELEELSPRTIFLEDPGNMTSYLEVFKGEQSHKITWGGNNSNPPEELQKFFDRTREKLKAL